MPLDGRIDERLPDGRFGFMPENNHRIIAHTAGRMRNFVSTQPWATGLLLK